MQTVRLSAIALAVAALIQACSSGDNVQSGVFLDSAVQGASYSTSSGLSGTTDTNGRFEFRPGDEVTFKLAGVTLPTAKAAALVTPMELAGGSSPDDPATIAIARLLQTLDKDGNPDNGLQIDVARLAANAAAPGKWGETSDDELRSRLASGVTLKSADDARKHFRKTYDRERAEPKLTLVGRYAPFTAPYSGSADDRLVAEIVGFHPSSQSAFITVDTTSQKSSFRRVSLASLPSTALASPVSASNLTEGTTTNVAADLLANGGFVAGGVQSLDVSGNLLAIAVQASVKTDNGRVAFYRLSSSGAATFLTSVEVGALPDGVAFSPDGKFLVVANEGELPSSFVAGTSVDPEGTISIIPIKDDVPVVGEAVTLDFKAFNVGGARHAELPADVRIGRPGATVAQDLEPEYVTISEDSKTAFVTLQENNAIAVVDLKDKKITKIIAMGYKDHGLERNRIAPSDRYVDGTSTLPTVPPTLKAYPGLYGIYMPDGIATFNHEGKTYVITANEGDDRDDFLNPDETARVSTLTLDATAFPNGAALKLPAELGRLTTMAKTARRADGTAVNFGDSDGDNDYDKLYILGGRSFSILEVDSGKMVFDSGSDVERIVYNDANDDANYRLNLLQADPLLGRLDNKGPEPESVVVGTVRGQTYAFVGLERSSGILVYNITNPNNPRFVQYIRNTNTLADGDLSPEGMKFVPANKSPNGKALLLVGYEISGSMAVFTFE
ncbi:MAG: choice-of-anchor I family protein [Burkholderiales bacterium]